MASKSSVEQAQQSSNDSEAMMSGQGSASKIAPDATPTAIAVSPSEAEKLVDAKVAAHPDDEVRAPRLDPLTCFLKFLWFGATAFVSTHV